FPILLLRSRITPMDTGASTQEKVRMFCRRLSSRTEKFSLSRPVTRRSIGSVTVIGMRTRLVSTRNWMPVRREAFEEIGIDGSALAVVAGAAGAGVTWTSLRG